MRTIRIHLQELCKIKILLLPDKVAFNKNIIYVEKFIQFMIESQLHMDINEKVLIDIQTFPPLKMVDLY